ncbi:MAG: class I SAM-dependent methyltransferase [Verrucomicrobia bacterium]|nr:class I SAM-dependent methyltransferase [Verrucomicrobiota bacterium]
MPSSRPNTIPTVIHLIRQFNPKSILDVGVGFGKWGHLFREYTDINEAEKDPARYQRRNWRVRIDGIEGHADYLTPMHRYLYNNIFVGDARALMKKLPPYDLVFIGDVIEHFTKPAGFQLLRAALKKARKAVIVTTPKYETWQEDLCGNELERHRSLWAAKDFHQFDNATVKVIDRATLLAVIVKASVPVPVCTPPMPMNQTNTRRLQKCREALVRLIPTSVPFILVDDEQLRTELPHTRLIPFLEKNGNYWGPPEDDAIAIRELERLRKSGAQYIAFAWPAFWWLEHYTGFQKHLCERCCRVVKEDWLVVFTLQN